MSLRSISVDETPDIELRPILATDLKPVDEMTVKEVAVAEFKEEVKEEEIKIEEKIENNNEATNLSAESEVIPKAKEKPVEYDSTCEGTSVVKTKLLPGKVR